MNQTQLRVFTAAAENRSFTKTAEQLFISQAAVTQHIQALEAALGCTLFDRRKRPMRLTQAGQTFYVDAKKLLEQMETAITRTKDAAAGGSGNLHIGFLKGYERSDLSVIARRFRAGHPNTFLTFERQSSDQLASGLMQGLFDLIFTWDCTNLRQNPEISWRMTDKIRLVVAMYSGHPLAGRIQLNRSELRGESILYMSPSGDFDSYGDAVFIRLYQESGFVPNILYRTSDLEVILTMVAAEEGISILPEYFTSKHIGADNLVFVPLIGEMEHEEIDAIWRKDNRNPILKEFISGLNAL
ncbi:MAG: LysR family transcriptional regulator [Oscillospiraceae bacterium]|nr:LysR family transcriptional regulator [Oscillospiraceae bacterium]